MTEQEKSVYKNRLAVRHKKWTGFGEEHSGPEWARLFGIDRSVMWRYLKKGLTIEEIAEIREIKYS
jgi:Fic family protein